MRFQLLKLGTTSLGTLNKQIILKRRFYFESTNGAALQEFLRLNIIESIKKLRLTNQRRVPGLDVPGPGKCVDLKGVEESCLLVGRENVTIRLQIALQYLELGRRPRTSESLSRGH